MRYTMLLAFITATIVVGNILDVITNTQDFTPNGPVILVGSLLLVALFVYMFKTPDRNFVPLRKIKQHLPEDVYKELKRKGPFQ